MASQKNESNQRRKELAEARMKVKKTANKLKRKVADQKAANKRKLIKVA